MKVAMLRQGSGVLHHLGPVQSGRKMGGWVHGGAQSNVVPHGYWDPPASSSRSMGGQSNPLPQRRLQGYTTEPCAVQLLKFHGLIPDTLSRPTQQFWGSGANSSWSGC